MSEYNLTHFSVGKYKKEAKMAAQMTKELQKAAKAKPKETKAKIEQKKVVFGNRKEVLIRENIAKVQRNKDKKIIVVATKLNKKKHGEIYALRFSDEKEFNEFFEVIKNASEPEEPKKAEEPKKPEPGATKPTPESDNSESRTRTPPSRFSESRRTSSGLSPPVSYAKSLSVATKSREHRNSMSNAYTRSSYTPLPQAQTQSQINTRSSYSQASSSSMRSRSAGVATYVTTDAVPSRTLSSTPRRGDRVSAKDVYPMKEKTVKGKDKSRAETTRLIYVPCKGMVKSTEGNVYLYSKTNPSGSPSLLSSSSSTSTDSLNNTQLFRVVRISRSNSTSSRSSSSSSSSSSSRRSRNASSSSSTIRVKKVNVWKYQNRRASNSTTSSMSTDAPALDERIAGRQSGSRSPEYVRCPTCRHRSRSLARKL